jgi:hypothetical protein
MYIFYKQGRKIVFKLTIDDEIYSSFTYGNASIHFLSIIYLTNFASCINKYLINKVKLEFIYNCFMFGYL